MEWTRLHYAKRTREKPEWFTPLIIATILDEYIPAECLGGLGGAKRQRRGSAVRSVRESLRESMRCNSLEGGGDKLATDNVTHVSVACTGIPTDYLLTLASLALVDEHVVSEGANLLSSCRSPYTLSFSLRSGWNLSSSCRSPLTLSFSLVSGWNFGRLIQQRSSVQRGRREGRREATRNSTIGRALHACRLSLFAGHKHTHS